MTKLQREIISRSAMGVLALGFLLGGYKCVATGVRIGADMRQRMHRSDWRERRSEASGTGIFYVSGGVLLLLGSAFGLAAVLPTSAFERLLGPPNIRTHEQPDTDALRHGTWWF